MNTPHRPNHIDTHAQPTPLEAMAGIGVLKGLDVLGGAVGGVVSMIKGKMAPLLLAGTLNGGIGGGLQLESIEIPLNATPITEMAQAPLDELQSQLNELPPITPEQLNQWLSQLEQLFEQAHQLNDLLQAQAGNEGSPSGISEKRLKTIIYALCTLLTLLIVPGGIGYGFLVYGVYDQKRKKELEEKIEELQEKLEAITKERDESEEDLKERNNELSASKRTNYRLNSNLTQTKNEKAKLERENTQLKEEKTQLEKGNTQLKEENTELEKENTRLEEENTALSAARKAQIEGLVDATMWVNLAENLATIEKAVKSSVGLMFDNSDEPLKGKFFFAIKPDVLGIKAIVDNLIGQIFSEDDPRLAPPAFHATGLELVGQIEEVEAMMERGEYKSAYDTIHQIFGFMQAIPVMQKIYVPADTIEYEIKPEWVNEDGYLYDFFDILEIEIFDSQTEKTNRAVNKARRTLAQKYHPDHAAKNGLEPEEAERMMQIINEAAKILTDPDQFAHYIGAYKDFIGFQHNGTEE